jgi:hypothetical protein
MTRAEDFHIDLELLRRRYHSAADAPALASFLLRCSPHACESRRGAISGSAGINRPRGSRRRWHEGGGDAVESQLAKAGCVHRQGKYEGMVKVKVLRAILADKNSVGIGTFQSKDEKTGRSGAGFRNYGSWAQGKHIAPHTFEIAAMPAAFMRPAGPSTSTVILRSPIAGWPSSSRSSRSTWRSCTACSRRRRSTRSSPRNGAGGRHCRGHLRPDIRAGVQAAAEQRVHGSGRRSPRAWEALARGTSRTRPSTPRLPTPRSSASKQAGRSRACLSRGLSNTPGPTRACTSPRQPPDRDAHTRLDPRNS